jgi:hypothetical protein
MNATISKKEIILGLHQNGKSLDEIQATLMIMFEDDLINTIEVNIIVLWLNLFVMVIMIKFIF